MKKSSPIFLNKLSETQLDSLTTEIKETIASGVYPPNFRSFTAADLWNIQRNGRSRSQRRFL